MSDPAVSAQAGPTEVIVRNDAVPSSSRFISISASHAAVLPRVQTTDERRPVGVGPVEHLVELGGSRWPNGSDDSFPR
jgi:hypothetical protein